MFFLLIILNILFYIYVTYFCVGSRSMGLTTRRFFMISIINWKDFFVYFFLIVLSFHLMFYLYYYVELLSLIKLDDDLYTMGKGNIKGISKFFSESDIKKDIQNYKSISNSVGFERKGFTNSIVSQTALSSVSENVGFKDFKSLDLKINKINIYASQYNFYSMPKSVLAAIPNVPIDLSKTTLQDLFDNLYIVYIGGTGESQKLFLGKFNIFGKSFPLCDSMENSDIHPLVIYDHKYTDTFFGSMGTSWQQVGDCDEMRCGNALEPWKVLKGQNFKGDILKEGRYQWLTQPRIIKDLKFIDYIKNNVVDNSSLKVVSNFSNFDFNETQKNFVRNSYPYESSDGFWYSKGKLMECCNLMEKFINNKN